MATLTRSKVLEYVDKYWNTRNPLFFDYGDADCTNFVSQCWNYGGIPQTDGWKPFDVLTGRIGGTSSWTVVDDFANYMVNNGIATLKWSSTEAQVGDVIQFYNEARGGWYHSAIVSTFDPTYGLCYAAHSDNHRQRPLSDVYLKPDPVYDGTLSLVRFICPNSAI